MWKAISQVLADQFGAYYNIKQKTPVLSGETHEAWIIDDGIQPVFVKVNEKSYRSMFRAEADQLDLLAKSHTIHVPRVYGIGCSTTHAFLLLEAFTFQTSPLSSDMTEFGEKIAQLHQWKQQDKYGLDFDTWLGKVHQPNEWKTNWATFFSEQRIGWQLQLCKEKNIEFGDVTHITQAIAAQLAKHNPSPALLHGDLWAKNYGATNQGIIVYDPACYWGDRECDIAFSELFSPFSPHFYEAYHRVYPLDEGYAQRKPIYQLYYLLNFSHRYQGEYIEKAQQIIDLFL
ncbi:fructosamine kinase family protein [Conservatibacter flavescens]|uniref:Fructosamine kinase family protein n=1 Tax=Conservatibacter flavescens TaxID=28161 RepID=A0A2M8S5B1_9PAST|nr:fructosamine kinase family protein [Conservatibacter flavescens]PJG86332.1 fructosamine kinase family protein [Conservatibacter flavescens]